MRSLSQLYLPTPAAPRDVFLHVRLAHNRSSPNVWSGWRGKVDIYTFPLVFCSPPIFVSLLVPFVTFTSSASTTFTLRLNLLFCYFITQVVSLPRARLTRSLFNGRHYHPPWPAPCQAPASTPHTQTSGVLNSVFNANPKCK